MKFNIFLLIAALVAAISCKKSSEVVVPQPSEGELKEKFVQTYAEIVYLSYLDSYHKSLVLKDKIQAFVSEPGEASFNTAKSAWLESRIPYLQTEAYRFYGGPIDGEGGPEALINAWPLDEVYIDYVKGQPDAGIINNTEKYPVIDKQLLAKLNGMAEDGGEGEKNISTGYHAIEFLLWGQDTSSTGPGNRKYTDYVPGGTASNQERRGQFLLASATLLCENLQYLTDAWAPGGNNYRTNFLKSAPDSALQKIMSGITTLAWEELGSQRVQVAYDTKFQEEEHSCFSDNTHQDFIYDLQGIENIYNGSYQKSDGTKFEGIGLKDVVGSKDAGVQKKLEELLMKTHTSIHALHPPFDQEILTADGRKRVAEIIVNLNDLADQMKVVSGLYGLQ